MNCKLRKNASECFAIQLEMFLYYLEHVSKPFCGQYSMKNLDITAFQDIGADPRERREPAL